jgi:hypothetical protein
LVETRHADRRFCPINLRIIVMKWHAWRAY